jgi:hypothetical protein
MFWIFKKAELGLLEICLRMEGLLYCNLAGTERSTTLIGMAT